MTPFHKNQNRMAAMLEPRRSENWAGQVYAALVARSVEWPGEAKRALHISGLHENVLVILIEIAARSVRGETPGGRLLRHLRLRLKRYHPPTTKELEK